MRVSGLAIDVDRLFLVVGIQQHDQDRPIDAEGRLDHMGQKALAGLLLEVASGLRR